MTSDATLDEYVDPDVVRLRSAQSKYKRALGKAERPDRILMIIESIEQDIQSEIRRKTKWRYLRRSRRKR